MAYQAIPSGSAWVVIGPTVGDSQNLTIFTGRDGNADGGYEIVINLAAVAGAEEFTISPNGAATGCSGSHISIAPGAGTVTSSSRSDLFVTDASAGNIPRAHIYMQSSTVPPSRNYECNASRDIANNVLRFQTFGNIAAAAGQITSLVLTGTTADSIKAGSYVRWRTIPGFS